MADQTTDTSAQLAALLARLQNGSAPFTPGSAWNKPVQTATPEIMGVSVPIALETPLGKVRVGLILSPGCASSPEALMQTVEKLHAAGYPLDAWQPRDSGNAWGGNRTYSRGNNWRR